MKAARAFIFYLGIAAMALPIFLCIVLSWPLPLQWRWKIACCGKILPFWFESYH